MKILGVHYGHNATVGLLQNGKVIFCQSEERINGLKNSTGFPAHTLKEVYERFGNDIDLAVLPGATLLSYSFLKESGFKSTRYIDYFRNMGIRVLIVVYSKPISEFLYFIPKRCFLLYLHNYKQHHLFERKGIFSVTY